MSSETEHPLKRAMQEGLPEIDFGVMDHGFLQHGRDYRFVIESSLISEPGTYHLTFTHVVEFKFSTALSDDTWQESWGDEFIDYNEWERAGEPSGYVWGTNWSLAYPGIEPLSQSFDAAEWARRLKKPMHGVTITTDRFEIELVFHALRSGKINDDASTVANVIHPL